MSSPAGWHPDPSTPPGQPPQLRYWDGTQWTEHTAPAPVTTPYSADGRATTPDGEPLAGWWHRVGAYVIDAVILLTIGTVATLPWWREMIEVYLDYFDEIVADAEAGRQTTTTTIDLQSMVRGPLVIITLINLAIGFAYQVGFLMWKQATPGKLATGLRVRLRETPGPMPLGTVILRWLGQFGYSVVTLIPVIGSCFGLYSLLDILWPLWDDKKQAIHDKIARTNVVRVR